MLKLYGLSPLFQPSPVAAEVYCKPSEEVLGLVRTAPWLTSPEAGDSPPLGALGLKLLIAPMTQLTFLSFDLQAFLFVVFHRSRVAMLGHGIFQTSVNLFLMAALSELALHRFPFGTLDAALLYTGVLLAWYGSVAFQARLRGWFALTAPLVLAMYLAAGPLASICRAQLHLAPGWGVLASAFLVAASHAAEDHLPPRTVDRWRWVPLREHLLEPGLGVGARLLRLAHMGLLTLMGTVAEAWASLRLMPYNWLFPMMQLGYAPARRAELNEWCDRAWATGNPALDFVGTGGGTFLAPSHR